MDQYTRRIVGFGIHAGDIDGIALCRIFNAAISNKGIPRYLSSDNDPLFRYHRWQTNLRTPEVSEIKSIPYTPISDPFIERLIGTIRREYLDRISFWNAQVLERKLQLYARYYNQHRTHQSLNGKTPVGASNSVYSKRVGFSQYGCKSHCHGLFETPFAA